MEQLYVNLVLPRSSTGGNFMQVYPLKGSS